MGPNDSRFVFAVFKEHFFFVLLRFRGVHGFIACVDGFVCYAAPKRNRFESNFDQGVRKEWCTKTRATIDVLRYDRAVKVYLFLAKMVSESRDSLTY